MKYLLLVAVGFVSFFSQAVNYGIVGQEKVTITQGVNRVRINWAPLTGKPQKLQSVMKFVPSDNVIGDKIEFDWRGTLKSFIVAKWDAEASTYVLKGDKNGGGEEYVKFAALPLIEEIRLNHQNSKPLNIEISGYITGDKEKDFQRTQESIAKDHKERKVRNLQIREVYKGYRVRSERNRKAMEARHGGVK